MLDAMLPTVADEENLDVTVYFQSTEEARQPAHLRIKNRQMIDSRCYNLRQSFME